MPGQKAPEAERRRQILEATLAVALKRRLSGLTIREVARVARLSPALVLFHYRSRDALVVALLERLVKETAIVHRPRPEGRVRGSAFFALVHDEARRLSSDRARSELFFDFWVAGTRHPELRRVMRRALVRYRGAFRDLALAECATTGHAHPGFTPDAWAGAAVSFVYGCALQSVIDPSGFDVDPSLDAIHAVSSAIAGRLGTAKRRERASGTSDTSRGR
ncbi:MAG: TetR/AcrR family transcriptional regulator [Vicinamibacterales bacterium]